MEGFSQIWIKSSEDNEFWMWWSLRRDDDRESRPFQIFPPIGLKLLKLPALLIPLFTRSGHSKPDTFRTHSPAGCHSKQSIIWSKSIRTCEMVILSFAVRLAQLFQQILEGMFVPFSNESQKVQEDQFDHHTFLSTKPCMFLTRWANRLITSQAFIPLSMSHITNYEISDFNLANKNVFKSFVCTDHSRRDGIVMKGWLPSSTKFGFLDDRQIWESSTGLEWRSNLKCHKRHINKTFLAQISTRERF